MALRFRITNVPHVPRTRAFREAWALVRNPVAVFEQYRQEYGRTFSVHLGGARPAIVSTDPSFVHHALRDVTTYHVSTVRVDRMAEFQGEGLINSHGDVWVRKRRLLNRTVRQERLALLLPRQERLLLDLLTRFEAQAGLGAVDIHQLMIDLTSHLVARSIFGARMTDAQIDHIVTGIRTVQSLVLQQIFQPYLITWNRLSGRTRRYQGIRRVADQIARDYIAARAQDPGEDDGEDDGNVLATLLTTPTEETGAPMDGEQILTECMQFLVAGCETSPVALSWTLYLLAKHPQFIERIRQETDSVVGTGPITVEALPRLRLTRQVIDEAMRIYSPFWMIDRLAVAEDVIDGVRIPRGVMVLPYIFGLHRDPELWPNPLVFDPSRFEDQAVASRHPAAHIPFGGGPRKCIGSNMALQQMLLLVATFTRRYDFELATDREVEFEPRMILHPKGAIEMRVRPR